MPPTLVGARVALRTFRAEDALDVFVYASKPEVTLHLEWGPHRTPWDSGSYVRRCMVDDPRLCTFAIEHLELQRVIGAMDLRVVSRLRRIGEIGYTLSPSFWGQGYNVEAGRLLFDYAFGERGLRRLVAVCDTDNHRSYRTMEKLGMTRECLLERARIRNGLPVDRYRYSILRNDYLARRGPAAVPCP